MSKGCEKCGSAKIIPNLQIIDQGQYSDGHLKAVSYTNPQAWVFKGRVYARLFASVCGECGHTEIRTDNYAELYEAYVASLVSAEQANADEPCLACGALIPAGKDRCPACHWSFLDQLAAE